MELQTHLEHIRSNLYNFTLSANHNASNITFEVVDWYLRIWSVYGLPIAIFLGLMNNTLILVVMPRSLVGVPRRVKRYYMWVAFFDLLTIVTNDLLFSYLEDGLFFTTGGSFVIRTRSLGKWACKTLTIALKAATFFASYFLAYLTVERTFAVCAPLVAKRFFSANRSHFVVPTVISSSILAVQAIFTLLMDEVMWMPGGQNLCFRHPKFGDFLYQLYIWYACTVQYFLHPFVLLVCSLLICIKMLRQTKTRKHFVASNARECTLRHAQTFHSPRVTRIGSVKRRIRHSSSVQFSFLPIASNIPSASGSESVHTSGDANSLHPPERVRPDSMVRVLREEGLLQVTGSEALTPVAAALTPETAIALSSAPSSFRFPPSPTVSRHHSQQRYNLSADGSLTERPLIRPRRTRVSRETRASLTVVTLALMQCVAYLPCGTVCMFMCVALASGSEHMQREQPEYFANLLASFIFIETVFTLAHVWNLYIYLIKVR